jgi:hypothetical protein
LEGLFPWLHFALTLTLPLQAFAGVDVLCIEPMPSRRDKQQQGNH